jgi:hypothetical protein
MIYDFTLNIGDTAITNSASTNFDNDQKGDFILDSFYIPILNRTGTNDFTASLNSQTIVERDPTYQQSQFDKIYSTDGDFYFKTGESISKMFFENLSVKDLVEKNLLFDLRPTAKSIIGTGQKKIDIANSIVADANLNLPEYSNALNELDYFLNGQKLYYGLSYQIINNTGFKYNETITGKIFGIPKKLKTKQFTDSNPDLYGQKFIENEVNLYINGMEQSKNLWIEITTGVTLIETGIVCQIFEEMNSIQVIKL